MTIQMDNLDAKIQAALVSATDLPDELSEPALSDELLSTFNGRHSWLMKWGLVKMAAASLGLLFCCYQFFQQDSTMAMIAYASGAILSAIAYGSIVIFIWVQMNHNTTVREIKRLELQLVMLNRVLGQQKTSPQEQT